MSDRRTVSLIASATEIVCALGGRDHLVGRSHECDYPLDVLKLPCCTESRISADGKSREIDRSIKDLLANALSVYRVDAAQLRALAPEIIVTQTQCEVCAVTPDDLTEALREWLGGQPQIVALEPNGLSDVWRDIGRVAEALEVAPRARELTTRLQGRMSEIERVAAGLAERPRIACIEWIDPLMAAGNWMPTLVRMAGGHNLFGVENAHSPWLTWEALRSADPDAIVVLPCGFDIATTRRNMPALTGLDGWQDIKAVRAGRVFLVDGKQYFNRPGPRLVESLEILAEILHPDAFRFGHQGTGWVRL